MAGNKQGGLKAREKNLAKDPDYYKKLGSKGAEEYRKRQSQGIAKPRGFALNREAAVRGGKVSKRGSRTQSTKAIMESEQNTVKDLKSVKKFRLWGLRG